MSLSRARELAHDMMEDGRNLGENATFLKGVHEGARDTGFVGVWNCVSLMVSDHHVGHNPTHPVHFWNQIRAWQRSLLTVTGVQNGNPKSRLIV